MAIDLTLNVQFVFGFSGNTTIDKPTDTVDGDFLLASCYHQSPDAHSAPDETWTQIATFTQTVYGSMRQTLYYKRAGASEPANYTFGTTSTHSVWLQRITDVVASGDPIDAGGLSYSPANTNVWNYEGGTVSCASITTVNAGAAIILAGAHITATACSSTTLTAVRVTGNRQGAGEGIQAIAGATGAHSITFNDTHYHMGVMFALKPAAGRTHNPVPVFKG